VKIFGHEFRHLDDAHLEQLLSLERERAIYADHWIDGLDDFRHVRIALTDGEVNEFVRSMSAPDLFLGSSAKWARNVRGIPADIAARADSYCSSTKDGQTLRPPWHCAAERNGPLSGPLGGKTMFRDLLYVMLRGSIFDIRREEPIPSRADTSKVADLFSQIAKAIIEVKWIAARRQWKKVVEEIYVDIQTYGRHADCRYLVFIVVDAARAIPDPHLIEQRISGGHIIDGKTIKVMAFVREP
jgi:hypothetical protein